MWRSRISRAAWTSCASGEVTRASFSRASIAMHTCWMRALAKRWAICDAGVAPMVIAISMASLIEPVASLGMTAPVVHRSVAS
eukprot:scaffold4268_cov56-Phaeocystis_antarctica.AAC.1